MKNIIFRHLAIILSLVVLIMTLVGCKKEEIKPDNSDKDTVSADDTLSDVRTRNDYSIGAVSSVENNIYGNSTLNGTTVYFTPEKDDAVLLNPDMGWVLLDVAEKGRQDMGETGKYPLVQNVGILTGWSELEPEEGKFNWSVLDETIDYWKNNSKRIHFRISTDCFPYYGSSYGCPEWVYDLGVQYQTKVDWSNQPVKYPDYNNATYREKLVNFLTAYADKYRNLDCLDIVDLRGYGEWGEWHSGYRYNALEERTSALKWILDTWCGKWNGDKMLLLSYSHETELGLLNDGSGPRSYEEYLSFSAFDYALDTFSSDVLGFRRDGVAGAITVHEKEFANQIYANSRIQIAEFCSGYDHYKEVNKPIISCIDEALTLHPNYMVLMGWDKNGGADKFYNTELFAIKYGLKKMGYRMELQTARYQKEIIRGKTLEISTDWKNIACGILPDGYTLKFQVYKGDEKMADALSGDFSSVFFANKDEAVTCTASIDTSKIEKGEYSLRYAILDTEGKPILLPVMGITDNGYYRMGEFSIK